MGNRILVDDGLIEMEVLATTDTEVKCKVLNNGALGENKGVNLPGVSVNLPALSEKDKNDLKLVVSKALISLLPLSSVKVLT